MIDYSRAIFNKQSNTNKAEPQEAFSLDKLKEAYKELDDKAKAWRNDPNYIGTRPEEGRFFTIKGVDCWLWIDPANPEQFLFRLINHTQDESKNAQWYNAVIAELDRQGVVAKRYG